MFSQGVQLPRAALRTSAESTRKLAVALHDEQRERRETVVARRDDWRRGVARLQLSSDPEFRSAGEIGARLTLTRPASNDPYGFQVDQATAVLRALNRENTSKSVELHDLFGGMLDLVHEIERAERDLSEASEGWQVDAQVADACGEYLWEQRGLQIPRPGERRRSKVRSSNARP